jgi:hypothetical protein
MGGLRSKEVQEQINMAVESIFDIRQMVKEMTDKGYGSFKTPDK